MDPAHKDSPNRGRASCPNNPIAKGRTQGQRQEGEQRELSRPSHPLQRDSQGRVPGGEGSRGKTDWRPGQRFKVFGGCSSKGRLQGPSSWAQILEGRAGKPGLRSRRGGSWTADRNMSVFQSFYLGTLRRSWLCKTTYYF